MLIMSVVRHRSSTFCLAAVLTLLSVIHIPEQDTRNAIPSRLYLLSATPSSGSGDRVPGGPGDRFPVNLYRVNSGGKLDLVRNVVPQPDGLLLAQSAGDVVFFVHPGLNPRSVSLVRTEDPMRADDVVFDAGGSPVSPTTTAAAEPQVSSIDILLPFMTDYSSAAGVRQTLAIVSSDPDKPGPRVRFDAWDEYAALRFDGLAGGPALVDCLGGLSAGDNLAIAGGSGRSVVVDVLPPALRAANRPENADIVAASREYFVMYVYPRFLKAGAPKNPADSKQLFVHDRVRDRWKTIQIEGDSSSSRLFGSWLATLVMTWNSNHKHTPAPGSTSGERDWGITGKLPNVRSWYADQAERFYLLPGILALQNLADDRKIRIETGQEDSEILWVGGNTVLYRVNDTIYQASIAGDKLQGPSVVVKDDDVPEVHWVFWSK